MTDEPQFDVFLCYNSREKPAVQEIARQLKERGLRVWLDEEQLRPGLPWQRALEAAIGEIGAAAVFVGESGIGPWQEEEIEAYLRQFVKRKCPVIPVLLPGAAEPKLPVFLEGRTWVDFRDVLSNAVEGLVWGITGRRRPAADDGSKSGKRSQENAARDEASAATGESRDKRAASQAQVALWRYADALVRRFEELSVSFDRPSRWDLGSWRPDAIWDEKFARFINALERLEQEVVGAPPPDYDIYAAHCQAIRDVLSASVQEPKGKFHYLNLWESRVIERLERSVQEDRASDSSLPVFGAPSVRLNLEDDEGRTYLRVSNVGPSADFWATLEKPVGVVEMPDADVFARWAHSDSYKATIPTGGNHRLYLARTELRAQPPGGTRHIQYATSTKVYEGRSANSWVHGAGYRETVEGTRVVLVVTLFSAPPLAGGPIRTAVQLEGTQTEIKECVEAVSKAGEPGHVESPPPASREQVLAHFEALVDADWREAGRQFWQRIRELEDEFTTAGRVGGSAHGFSRQGAGENDMRHRSALLVARATEVLQAAGGDPTGELGEALERSSLDRLARHYDDIEVKLDESKNVGRSPGFGRPDLGKEAGLRALKARFFVLRGGVGESTEAPGADEKGRSENQSSAE